jgi:hypothetical protein
MGILNVIVSFSDHFRSILNIDPDLADSFSSLLTDRVASFAQEGILKKTVTIQVPAVQGTSLTAA